MLKHCQSSSKHQEVTVKQLNGSEVFSGSLRIPVWHHIPTEAVPAQQGRLLHPQPPAWLAAGACHFGGPGGRHGHRDLLLGSLPPSPAFPDSSQLPAKHGAPTDHYPSYTLLPTIAEKISSMYRIHQNFSLFLSSNSKKTSCTVGCVHDTAAVFLLKDDRNYCRSPKCFINNPVRSTK